MRHAKKRAASMVIGSLGLAVDQPADGIGAGGHTFLGLVEDSLNLAASHGIVDRVGDIAQRLLHVRLGGLDETVARGGFTSVLHTAAGRTVGSGGCRTHPFGRGPLGGVNDVVRFNRILCSAHVSIVVDPARQVNSNIGLDHEFSGRDHRPQRRAVARYE